jgi:hypothetical protein
MITVLRKPGVLPSRAASEPYRFVNFTLGTVPESSFLSFMSYTPDRLRILSRFVDAWKERRDGKAKRVWIEHLLASETTIALAVRLPAKRPQQLLLWQDWSPAAKSPYGEGTKHVAALWDSAYTRWVN